MRLIGKAGELLQTVVTITPPAINKFDITSVAAKDGTNIQFKMGEKVKSEPQQFILNITNIKPDPGRYFDKITLKTTSTISPEISIRVFGIIRKK
ncbi:MAG: hypothetical protein J7K96_05495 [Desulfobacteraceae bacterium]|nr:hypothetical protein [Desulfobacteraceae bacterium]